MSQKISWVVLSVILLALFSLVFFLPTPTYAQQGLAQLAGCSGPDCGTCHVIKLANGLIMWLITFVFLLFAVLLVRAGVLLVTSGGNPGALQSAKANFINALVGLIIILAAWLIIDTIMKALVGKEGDEESRGYLNVEDERNSWLLWSQIKCTVQTEPNECTIANGCVEDLNLEHAIISDDDGGVDGGDNGGIPSPPGCSVPGISAITDPMARQMEAGVKVIYNSDTLRQCAQKFTSLTNGSVTSAYRPQAYQTHLWELHDRWCAQGLSSNNDSACVSLKTAVQAEMGSHGLSCGRPVAQTNSRHSSGQAIDVGGISHGSASVLGHARNSCLSWPLGLRDAIHYELVSGCSCN